MESHGGTLTVDGGPAGGATFTIALPVTRGGAQAAGGAAEAPPTPVSAKRILVVDDESAFVELLADLLQIDGNEFESAPNGRIALDRLAAGRFDLVVSDLRMPEMDGPALYREAQLRGYRVPFLFMTGDALRSDLRQFLEQTGAPHLVKPFGVHDLLATIAKALAARAEET